MVRFLVDECFQKSLKLNIPDKIRIYENEVEVEGKDLKSTFFFFSDFHF